LDLLLHDITYCESVGDKALSEDVAIKQETSQKTTKTTSTNPDSLKSKNEIKGA
jgi:hypothetical protein